MTSASSKSHLTKAERAIWLEFSNAALTVLLIYILGGPITSLFYFVQCSTGITSRGAILLGKSSEIFQ
jgi:hypothetical protein